MRPEFVWNKSAAEQIRQQSVEAMKRQADEMRATIEIYKNMITQLDSNASSQASVANTAMREERTRDSQGKVVISNVPDTALRSQASGRASDLQAQSSALAAAVSELSNAVNVLEDEITATSILFFNFQDMAQDTDSAFASKVRDTISDIQNYIHKMQALHDSFNNVFPLSAIPWFLPLKRVLNRVIMSITLAARLAGIRQANAYDGDPVNMSTGNFIYSKEDITIPGRYPLAFKRFYNSIGGGGGELGAGWTHNYNIRLENGEDDVTIVFDDGHSESYLKLDDDMYAAPLEHNNTLIRSDGKWILTSAGMKQYIFNNEGALQRITDINGDCVRVSHTGRLLSRVSNCAGSLTFEYDEDNHLICVSDHTGRKVEMEYTDNCLVKVVHPAGSVYEYSYNRQNLLSGIKNPLGVEALKNDYDESGRITKQSFADEGIMTYAYDDDEKTTAFTQQNGSKIIYTRDEKYRTTKISYPDGEERFEFNEFDQMILSVDKLGAKTVFSYDDFGNVSKTVNALGTEIENDYDLTNGQLRRVLVDGKEKLVNTYDGNGILIAVEDGAKNKTTLIYSQDGVPETITQPDGSEIQIACDKRKNITKIKDGSGITSQFRYDKLNRVTSSIDGNGYETKYKYDAAGNITEVENALGDTLSYTYDKNNNVTKITNFDGTGIQREYNALSLPSKFIDQLKRETLFNYDSMWNLAHIVEPNGAETKFTYNALNQLESVCKPDGGVMQYQYDACGNRTAITDEEGNKTIFYYDAIGQLIKVSGPEGMELSYKYNSNGQVTCLTDALGNIVNVEYDNAGRVVKEVNTLGDSRAYTFTSLGHISTITDEAGGVTSFEYLSGGLLSRVNYPDNTEEAYTYDNNGNVKTFTTKTGQVLSYEYDVLDRVIKITDAQGVDKHYTYDAVSNVTGMIDENGFKTVYEYTPTGEIARVTDALGNQAQYTYDDRNQLIEVRQLQADEVSIDDDLQDVTSLNSENKRLRITRYERDASGRVEAVIDSHGERESYTYNLRGQLIQKLDKDGYLTKFGYTAHGDVKNIQYADGREVKLSYNPLRQLTQIEDWLGLTKIESDALGRTTKVENHLGQEVSYSWNSAGQKTGLSYPNGTKVTYEYDELLRLKEVSDGKFKAQYNYDSYSRLTEKTYQNGAKTQLVYDDNDAGRLKELSHMDTGGILDRYLYEYDNAGNKTGITKERRDLPDESGIYKYTYDPLCRLREVQKDGKPIREYEYDGFGNRTSLTEAANKTSYTYNALNQLISTADTTGNEQAFSYDKRGNLTAVHKGGTLKNQYVFGALNRLEKAVNIETGIAAAYSYNGLGHRVGKKEGNLSPELPAINPAKQIDDIIDLTQQYNNLLQRTENNQMTSFIWDSSLLASEGAGGAYTGFMLDEFYSPVRTFSENGVYNAFGYDEFGNTLHGELSTKQPFGFTGYQQDTVAGTWFAQAREYDARNGRFVSEDIVEGTLFAPPTMNAYIYCLNVPLVLYDPNGMWLHIAVGAVVGAVVGVAAQAVSDIVTGNPPQLKNYVSAGVGGAVGGAVTAATGNPALGGAAAAGTSTLVKGVWDMADGTTEVSWENVGRLGVNTVVNSAIGYGLGAAGKAIGGRIATTKVGQSVSNFTRKIGLTGRNSATSFTQQAFTKFKNKVWTLGSFSAKSWGKIFGSQLIDGVFSVSFLIDVTEKAIVTKTEFDPSKVIEGYIRLRLSRSLTLRLLCAV